MDTPPMIHAGCACINLAILVQAIGLCNLRWRMHPAQVAAIEFNLPLRDVETMQAEAKELGPNLPVTLFGIPVSVDHECWTSHIYLMRGDEVLVRIENLAIPGCFIGISEEQENAAKRRNA